MNIKTVLFIIFVRFFPLVTFCVLPSPPIIVTFVAACHYNCQYYFSYFRLSNNPYLYHFFDWVGFCYIIITVILVKFVHYRLPSQMISFYRSRWRIFFYFNQVLILKCSWLYFLDIIWLLWWGLCMWLILLIYQRIKPGKNLLYIWVFILFGLFSPVRSSLER